MISNDNLSFTAIIEQDEDGYFVATVPSLKGCHTQAKTLEELYPRLQEVIELCLEEEQPTNMKLIGVQQIQISGAKLTGNSKGNFDCRNIPINDIGL
ncbi:type II toxin-antitoxin system HicB family antitoxin [Candidatus Thiosymbion oneisti]|uniref:type II toxin-antitoxin system HicB family antitoxin n=1 Tax=Candidatus Thiosymbion oneisti TaxID=589554 RepID=UPI000B3293DE|nr:type II toxin-antitoxin system HicB family antitoxin [Candidatus Thiosymbion oneisti]